MLDQVEKVFSRRLAFNTALDLLVRLPGEHICRPDKSAFRALLVDKDKIQSEFGEELQWQELEGRKASRIVLYRYEVNPADASQYEDLHAWMIAKMERFRKVFTARVKSLPSSAATESIGEEDETAAAK